MTNYSKIIAKDSDIQGRGIFAKQFIKNGEIVYSIQGKKVSLLKCFWLYLTDKTNIDNPLQISRYSYLILDDVSVLSNHSCNPSCAINDKNEMIARRDINLGEEITFDYSMTVLPQFYIKNWKMQCKCGAKNCRKTISTAQNIDKAQLKIYIKDNKMQNFIKKYLLSHYPELFVN